MSPDLKHPFHLVEPSPWPFVSSVSVLILAIGAVLWMHKIDHYLFGIGVTLLLLTFFGWWRDVVKESNSPGVHTKTVQRGLQIGMGLFIASEVMFFAAFFWGYFHAALAPTEASGFVWPPKNIVPFDPFHLPYLNTLLLLLSGTTVTWAHHELLRGDMKNTAKALLITVLLGATFTVVQAIEYSHAAFALKDGIYPSTFYLATGFHGFHVIVGTLFLLVCWWRTKRLEFTSTHHVGFEAAAWYWHFVDVVWLFLFVSIYWWGYSK
ncbi:MAG: cytochrome c oxidase subunit 3 [Alphaproteobacteria bacterium]|nr:cytochrome c oxidase subunit 3 [Alphaproteobacteria bacterium]